MPHGLLPRGHCNNAFVFSLSRVGLLNRTALLLCEMIAARIQSARIILAALECRYDHASCAGQLLGAVERCTMNCNEASRMFG
jgi:hypothetical protein